MANRAKRPRQAADAEVEQWFAFHQAYLRCSTLTDSQHRVLGALFSYADGPQHNGTVDDQGVWRMSLQNARPGVTGIMAATGYARSTVQRALRDLEAAGWIHTAKEGGRAKGGRGCATVYQLTVPTTIAEHGDAEEIPVSAAAVRDTETAPLAGPLVIPKGPTTEALSEIKGPHQPGPGCPTGRAPHAPPAGPYLCITYS